LHKYKAIVTFATRNAAPDDYLALEKKGTTPIW
jgi:hypothetical protein